MAKFLKQNDFEIDGLPVGSIVVGSTERVPDGFMRPIGQALRKDLYAELNALYSSDGYPYGSDSTTFNLPTYSDPALWLKTRSTYQPKEDVLFSMRLADMWDYKDSEVLKTPNEFFPYVCVNNPADGNFLEISETNAPYFVEDAITRKLELWDGSAFTSSFGGTVAGSIFTLTDNALNNSLWSGLKETGKLFYGPTDNNNIASGITNFMVARIGGVDYEITALPGTRQITLASAPTGTSIEIYPYRVGGDSTKVRMFSQKGLSRIASGDADGYFLACLARRGYFQGHNRQGNGSSAASGGGGNQAMSSTVNNGVSNLLLNQPFVSDGTNGTPRTAKTTNGPVKSVYSYICVGIWRNA
jgi:hypothetical protein